MKYLIALCLVMLSACASKPVKIMVKNCEALGSNLYSCEEIPQKDIQPRK
jgi:hypothetical protein